MKTLTLVTNYDDWEGVYLDGKIVDQGHRIDWREVLKSLGHIVKYEEADSAWLSERGCLPKKLEDCKFAVED